MIFLPEKIKKYGIEISRHTVLILTGMFCFFLFSGCSKPDSEPVSDFIMKTAAIGMTLEDFSEELDLKQAAYPYNIEDNPVAYNQMVLDLVGVLTEELILLNAASDKGISLEPGQLEAAIADFKSDYPGDSFKQILLENAISYPLWCKRFEKNMIIDKLIDQELRKKIEITASDIIGFYQHNKKTLMDKTGEKDAQSVLKNIESEKKLISMLRLKKTQEEYGKWMTQLKKEYPVEINNEILSTFFIGLDKNKDKKKDES